MQNKERRVRPGESYREHHMTATRGSDERTFADLLRELSAETRTLVRQEISLARTELSEKVSEAGKDAGLVGAGGAVAYAGMIVLAVGLALLLGLIMPNWLAFLIVGAAVVLLGYVLLQTGLSRLKKIDFALSKTADSLQEDKEWIQEEVRQVRHNETGARPGGRRVRSR